MEENDLLDEQQVGKVVPEYLGKWWQHFIVLSILIGIVIYSFFATYSLTMLSVASIRLEFFLRAVIIGGGYYFLVIAMVLIRDTFRDVKNISDGMEHLVFIPVIALLSAIFIIILMVVLIGVVQFVLLDIWQLIQPDVLEIVSRPYWFGMNVISLFITLSFIHYIIYRKLLSA